MTHGASDLEALLEAAGGDTVLARELAEVFIGEMTRRMSEMRSAVARGDLEGLEASAHALKGSAAAIGFKDVAGAALAIERSTRSGPLDRGALEVQISRLSGACHAAGRSARSFLGSG
jgi:HPt (histidine-containing phosphotransfer) domain-containing protein